MGGADAAGRRAAGAARGDAGGRQAAVGADGGAPRPVDGREDPSDRDVELLDAVVDALGGARRQGQEEMVRAVARALAEEGHLLVQAGTGTGKSLGYLVPAMRWAVDEGARVIVSTATLALQRQIVDHDAPRGAEA